MNTESGAHGVAPINFFSLQVSAAPAIINCAAFSTGIIGTGLAFSLYAILKGGRHGHNAYNSFTPVHWLEHPAAYVPPRMDLFTDDEVPFGVSSSFSCPKDTEHLERAFDLLRYQHMSGKLGVPSISNQDTTLVQPLRVLGNASGSAANSGFDSSTQGGRQKTNGGSTDPMGGEKNESSHSKPSYFMALRLTRLLFVPGDWSGISMAPLIAAIAVVTLLAKRGCTHCQSSSEPSTTLEEISGVQEAGPVCYDNDTICDEECTPCSSSELALSVSINHEQPLEQLFEVCPLIDSSILGAVLDVFGNDPHARSDVGFPEVASSPVDSAAQFDALQDAPFFDASPSDVTLANDLTVPDLELLLIGTQRIEPSANGSNNLRSIVDGNTENGAQIIDPPQVDDDIQEARERTIEALTTLQPSCSTSASASTSLLGQTVETLLTPAFEEEKADADGDYLGGPWTFINRRGKRGRGKGRANVVPEEAVQANNDNLNVETETKSDEPVSSLPSSSRREEPLRKKRGRRGHGRGRGSRPSQEAGATSSNISNISH